MAKYRVEYEVTEDGYSRWVQPVPNGYKMACCDCGLVHDMDFRIEDGRVQFRAKRNVRSTAAVRREKKKGCRQRLDSLDD